MDLNIVRLTYLFYFGKENIGSSQFKNIKYDIAN